MFEAVFLFNLMDVLSGHYRIEVRLNCTNLGILILYEFMLFVAS
jgi:hypothetical protein